MPGFRRRPPLPLQVHETRKAGFLAVKSSFRFLKEIPAYAAEKPGFLPSKAEDTFLPDFWFHEVAMYRGV